MKARSIAKIGLLSTLLAVSSIGLSTAYAADSSDGGSAGDRNTPLSGVKRTFSELDKNGDGIVDKTEAKADISFGALVNEVDTNKDGSVSQPEYDAYVAKKTAPTSLKSKQ